MTDAPLPPLLPAQPLSYFRHLPEESADVARLIVRAVCFMTGIVGALGLLVVAIEMWQSGFGMILGIWSRKPDSNFLLYLAALLNVPACLLLVIAGFIGLRRRGGGALLIVAASVLLCSRIVRSIAYAMLFLGASISSPVGIPIVQRVGNVIYHFASDLLLPILLLMIFTRPALRKSVWLRKMLR
jgi:hypothetical protein